MTISEAIERVNALKPNQYTDKDKREWLGQLDWKIKTELIDGFKGRDDVFFNGYDEETEPDQQLLVPSPHDKIYIDWLCAQIDYYNAEYDRYNNDITVFNDDMAEYSAWYIRHREPITRGELNY